MQAGNRAGKVDKLLLTALNNSVFSGASFAFSIWEKNGYKRFIKNYGYAQREPEKKLLLKDSVFDLASLTKPLTTVPLLLALFEKKSIAPDTKIGDILSFCPDDKVEIKLSQLMAHSAGFPAHREFFHELRQQPEKQKKDYLLRKILSEPLITQPGKDHCYSDLGFMLLGLMIERLNKQNLDELAKCLVYEPMSLGKDLFFPNINDIEEKEYVSTGICPWSGKMLSGMVHDDNCRAMGGVAGHAGLFGTVKGVLSLCELFLDQWQNRGRQHPAYSNAVVQRTLEPVANSGRTMGFDMVSEEGSSSGQYFSRRSVGHLGFTGTSFWIDPVKDCIIVLLTNRVHPDGENWKIKEFRPLFHDLLMKE